MNRIIGAAALAVALAAIGTPPASAETVKLKAALGAAEEVPPNGSAGRGGLDATYDTVTRTLSWQGTYSGLTGPVTASHFHGPAAVGANAPVMVPAPAPTSPFAGSATLTEAQGTELTAGRMYFNVHTAANPGGEIRGQVIR